MNIMEVKKKYQEDILKIIVAPETHIDDEYAHAGVKDPKILITTSRDPSSRLQMFSKVCINNTFIF